jgi:hypothetical protein
MESTKEPVTTNSSTDSLDSNPSQEQQENSPKKKTRAPRKPKDKKNESPNAVKKSTLDGNAAPFISVTDSPTMTADSTLPLRTQVMHQLEYYFSDDNLTKDKFLLKEMEKDDSKQGYIALELLSTFPRMQKLTTNIEELRAAVRESSILKLSKSGQRVRRDPPFEVPLSEEQQQEQRTVYVSYLPKNSDRESVKGIFGICGNIRRVDLPLDKKTGEIKGIAFVEFEDKAQAKKAMHYFSDKGNDFYKLGIRVRAYSLKPPTATATSTSSSATTHNNGSNYNNNNNNEGSPPSPHHHHGGGHTEGGSGVPVTHRGHASSPPSSHPPLSSSPGSRESVYEQAPSFNYSKEKRKKRSGSKPEPIESKWEPSPTTSDQRPKLNLRPRSDSVGGGPTVASISPLRQPKGPDGSKGFALGRGKPVVALAV